MWEFVLHEFVHGERKQELEDVSSGQSHFRKLLGCWGRLMSTGSWPGRVLARILVAHIFAMAGRLDELRAVNTADLHEYGIAIQELRGDKDLIDTLDRIARYLVQEYAKAAPDAGVEDFLRSPTG